MASLNPARQNAILLAVLLLAQLVMMYSNANRPDGTTALENVVVTVTWPIVAMSSAIGGGFSNLVDGIRELRDAKIENERLRTELGHVRSLLDRYEEQALQNERLRELLEMKQHLVPETVGAHVLMATLSNQEHVLVIDRGSSSGVRSDHAVVTWGGAVGRVVSVSFNTARVRLLSDPNSGVAGVVQRSRQGGMLLGRGDPFLLEMAYVPSYADTRLNDRIVTSGLDGIFPPGIGIGRVTYLDDSSGITKTIRVEPEVDFAMLEEVLVIVPAGDVAESKESFGGES